MIAVGKATVVLIKKVWVSKLVIMFKPTLVERKKSKLSIKGILMVWIVLWR